MPLMQKASAAALLLLAHGCAAQEVWHIETYGSTLSPFITGDALELAGVPVQPSVPSTTWQVKNLNGSFAPTTLVFSEQFHLPGSTRTVANVTTRILDVFDLAGQAFFDNASAPGQPTEVSWITVDGTNANGYWQRGPSHAQPSPSPPAPGNADCHEIYDLSLIHI